ncbi:MAG: dihydrolipoyl dehydrogenase family protein, partial [Opitutales bacterium]
KKHKVTILQGHGRLAGDGRVEIEGKKNETVKAREIMIATGSAPIELPFLKFDGDKIVSSTDAIAFDAVPKRVAVIGAGAIGLELGSVWARLGSKVTVVEMLPQIAPLFDTDVATEAQKCFEAQGIDFTLCTKCLGYEARGGAIALQLEKDEKHSELEVDKVLVAIGRRPNTEGLGAEGLGIEMEKRGQIKVDAQFRTNVPGIRAIGDVTMGPMLAHKAEHEGVACAELIAGKAGHVNYETIPGVVYTSPEIALLGLTETVAAEQNRKVRVGKFPFRFNGRALANDATEGFAKVIADPKTDRILGAQVLGHNAGELIHSVVCHMEYGGSAEDLARTTFAHPTMTEALKEAAAHLSL